MKIRILIVGVLMLALVLGGCSSTKTVTLPGVTLPGVTVTLPGSMTTLPPLTVTLPGIPGATITQPGATVTLPAVTVTLPGSTTAIPGTIVTIPPFTDTIAPVSVEPGGLLPSTPPVIVTHANVITTLEGACLSCHGSGQYYQYPTAPFWDGGEFFSNLNPGAYYVVKGSIQDHTGRGAEICLTCHVVAKP